MNNYKRVSYLLATVCLFFSAHVSAQQELTLHFMQSVYQSGKTNPAFRTDSLPSFQVMNYYGGYYNSGFKFRDLSSSHNDGSPAGFLNNKIEGTNYMGNVYSSDIFSGRFRNKYADFSFGLTQKVNMELTYPNNLFLLSFYGNGDPYFTSGSNSVAFDGLKVNMQSYAEWWVGASYKWDEKLTLGLRYKLLFGQSAYSIENASGNFNTNPNSFEASGTADLLINTANTSGLNGMNDATNYNPFSGIKPTGNLGSGVDLGASYEINEKYTVNASVVNIGFINWSSGVNNYTTNGPQSYTGLSYFDVNSAIYKQQLTDVTDTVAKALNMSNTENAFITYLSPQIYLGGTYKLDEQSKAGLLWTSNYFNNEKLLNTYTAAYTRTLAKKVDLVTTYSIRRNSYFNLGLGASYRYEFVEVYAACDNLMAFVTPAYANAYNVRVGFNILLTGKKANRLVADVSKENISDTQSNSQNTIIKAIRDTDGDGVADSLDKCPTIVGVSMFGGCPDTDGDGIEDSKDACPSIYGVLAFNGCPDTDGDGIPDMDDKCPNKAGAKENEGCPKESNSLNNSEADWKPKSPNNKKSSGKP